jgi:hypothetical protein
MKYLLFPEGVAVEVELRCLLCFLAAASLAGSLCMFLQLVANQREQQIEGILLRRELFPMSSKSVVHVQVVHFDVL